MSLASTASTLAASHSVAGFPMPLPCTVSVEPTSAKVAVAGQIGRLVLRVRTAAGDEAFGAHLLVRAGASSGQVAILDREVTAVASYAGTAIAEARFLCGAGQAAPISIEIDVAGTETQTYTVNLQVRAPEIYMPAPDPWWGFGIYSALDKFNGLAATPDLFLEPPSVADPAGTKAYAGDAFYVPWLAFEAADVIFSHRQLELFDLGGWLSGASLGAPPPLWMVSTLPGFDGKGGKLDRSAVVRISCPADPSVHPFDQTVKFPDFTSTSSRDIQAVPFAPTYSATYGGFTYQSEPVSLAIEPVSGYVTVNTGFAPLAAAHAVPPPNPTITALAPAPGPIFSLPVSGVVLAKPPTLAPLSGVTSVGSIYKASLAAQRGTPGEPLPIPFQVKLIDAQGHTYSQAADTTGGVATSKGPIAVEWYTQGAEILASNPLAVTGANRMTVAIGEAVRLKPVEPGPWFLTASIKGSIFDPQAPMLPAKDPISGQSLQHRSALAINNHVYAFIIQRSGGGGAVEVTSLAPVSP